MTWYGGRCGFSDWLADRATKDEPKCEFAGHEWGDAGGGLLICTVCEAEKWDDIQPPPRDIDGQEGERPC